jgi:hypothetical protein
MSWCISDLVSDILVGVCLRSLVTQSMLFSAIVSNFWRGIFVEHLCIDHNCFITAGLIKRRWWANSRGGSGGLFLSRSHPQIVSHFPVFPRVPCVLCVLVRRVFVSAAGVDSGPIFARSSRLRFRRRTLQWQGSEGCDQSERNKLTCYSTHCAHQF